MKGNDVSLSGRIEIKFGWDVYSRQHSVGLFGGLFRRPAVDCDARAVFCGKNGKPLSDDLNKCSVYYGCRDLYGSAALHTGDNQTGGPGDSECIVIDLDRLPPEVDLIILTLDLFKEKKSVGAGKLQEAFVRVIDTESGQEVSRADIHRLNSDTKLVSAGRIQKKGDKWEFTSDGTAFNVKKIEDIF